jgi:hypothetical protein
MHADAAQELADQRQRGAEVRRIRAEPDAQEAVHVEKIAGHDQHTALLPQPLGQLRRMDRVRVADERDRTGLGRDVAQPLLPLDPPADERWIAQVSLTTSCGATIQPIRSPGSPYAFERPLVTTARS